MREDENMDDDEIMAADQVPVDEYFEDPRVWLDRQVLAGVTGWVLA